MGDFFHSIINSGQHRARVETGEEGWGSEMRDGLEIAIGLEP